MAFVPTKSTASDCSGNQNLKIKNLFISFIVILSSKMNSPTETENYCSPEDSI